MPNKKINQLDNRVGVALTDLSLVGDPTTGTSFKLTIQDISVLMGVPGKFNQPTGTIAQYIRGDGSLATFPSLTGFVPYTGATANVDLGTHRILAQNATIASSGSGDTVTLNHSSGSGIGLNITKGGSGEGLYINKTSGSGNAATIIGTLNATTLVKSGGTSSQFLKADGSVDSTTYVGGSGASGQVAYWNGTSSQTGSNNLFWDAANSRLGIGTNTPGFVLDIVGNTNAILRQHIKNSNNGTNAQSAILLRNDADIQNIFGVASTGYSTTAGIIANDSYVQHNDFNNLYPTSGLVIKTANVNPLKFQTNNVERARIFGSTGNLVLQNGGTFTDGGQRLQVQGDAFIRTSDTNATTSGLRILNSASSELFVVRNSGIVKVGDGAVDTGITGNLLQINSGLAFWAIRNNNGLEFIHSNATLTPVLTIGIYRGYSTGVVYNNLLLTRTFANGSANNAAYNSINVSDTINQTGGANGITRGLYVNPTLTAAADWRSIEWSNNSGWGLYGAGTANNYLGGNTTIRTNSSSYAAVLQVENTGSAAVDNKNVAFFIGARGNASNIDDNTNISVWQKNITVGNYGVLSFLNALGNLTAFVGAEYTTHTNNPTGNLIFGTTNSSTVAIKAKLFNTGNLLIQNGGTFTDSGYRLDVNGTARVSGAALFGSTSSFGGNMTLAVNQNDATTFQISNANSNASSVVVLNLVSSNGSASIGKRSNTTAVYRFLNVNDAYIYNSGNSGDIGILNDYASGSIKMGAGGSSTAHFTIKSNGRINMSSLPTSATGLSSGDLWNDGGTLKIV